MQSRQILDRVGHEIKFDNAKVRLSDSLWYPLFQAKDLLGMEFKNPADSLIDMAYSMIERGILPKRAGYRGPNRPPPELSRI